MTSKRTLEELNQEFNRLAAKSHKAVDEIEELDRVECELRAALRQELKPLIDELCDCGTVADVWDLVNTSAKYPKAIPILVKHLGKPYHRRNRSGIVRALAVKEAKGIANKVIINEYHRAPKEDFHFSWLFGNTMSVIVTKDDLDELIEIVTDESNGESRTGFIEALAKIKSPKVIEVLHQLENDKNQIVADRAKKILAKKAKAAERKTKKKKI